MIKVHSVVVGPHEVPETRDTGYKCMICVVEFSDGQVDHNFELFSNDFNWMYQLETHTKTKMEPYEIEENDLYE